MAQLLIELFSEEIPARMQLGAARDFERLFGAKLSAAGLSHEGMKAYVGPRRLALVVEGLPTETAAVTEEIKGPKESAPPQAMEGFLRKVGLMQEQLTLENGVWMARIEKPGVKTADVLGDMLREVILSFPWSKSMRSGTSTFRWVRPLKRILFLFDGEVIPFELEGLTAGNLTEGHRFLGSGEPLSVSDFASYQKALADNSVILDHAERQKIILEKARAVCVEAGCELIEDQGLLEEVAGLNEFPVPLLGDMDPAFLTLPPEVIKTSMRTHQKYFAVRDASGGMAAKFVITSNMKAVDGGEEIKRGNAKVLSARLSDGVFFWKEDNRAGNFDQWLTKLEGVTFHAKLGTMAQRVARITALAKHIAPLIGADAEVAGEAAHLAKADLASYMVGEFPELQGVMGGYYADAAKKPLEIADAIRQHYKPQGPSDSVPVGKVSACVALADKLDTLISFFAIDEKPTGSKDPFALRRSALGILRIIREHKLRLPLNSILTEHASEIFIKEYNEFHERIRLSVLQEYNSGRLTDAAIEIASTKEWILDYDLRDAEASVSDVVPEHVSAAAVKIADAEAHRLSIVNWRWGISQKMDELFAFLVDRLKVQLRDEGHRFDIVDSVLGFADNDVVRIVTKIDALEAILKTPQGDDLLAAHKRAANILAAEAKKGDLPTGEPKALPAAPAVETTLLTQLNTTKQAVDAALGAEKDIDALLAIAALRQSVDAFLDGVLVNADDAAIRANRLLILQAVCDLSGGIADLSKIA